MSIDVHKYCCDPFKKHGRRVHWNLRVASARLIAEHPSLSIQSGDLLCVNCLNQFTHTMSPLCTDRDECSAISAESS